jgi:hypothetical protein
MISLAELRSIVEWVHHTAKREPDVHIYIELNIDGVSFRIHHTAGISCDYMVSWDELMWSRFSSDMVTDALAERVDDVLKEGARCSASPAR